MAWCLIKNRDNCTSNETKCFHKLRHKYFKQDISFSEIAHLLLFRFDKCICFRRQSEVLKIT
jgi:hypothetical protein